MNLRAKSATLAAAITLLPATAWAHTGVGDTHGFMHGFMHPVGGLDHVLAMIAVGLFAAMLGGRALWMAPIAFVAMMGFGGLLGVNGVELPFVELGIAASVIVLGAAVALRPNTPTAVAVAVVGFFAIFHGFAHGAEMPVNASGLSYAIGFMVATALLHTAGIGAMVVSTRLSQSGFLVRAAGGAMTLAGVAIAAGAV